MANWGRTTKQSRSILLGRTRDRGGVELNFWDEARRGLKYSNCLKRKYACVIVRGGVIISKGWNESLTECVTCTRIDTEHNAGSYAECPSIHAEQKAMIECQRRLQGAELYLVCDESIDPTPCPGCQKLMDFYGVKQVRER